MIPLVFSSSLITKFLNTGLFNISLKPLSLSTPSSFKVLKLSNLSWSGASELLKSGMSKSVITLWTQSKLWILYLRLNKLFIEASVTIPSLGVYVRIKNSLDPYRSEISCKYVKSGSPSINKVSDEASSLKSLE